jgi:hypothetical protein
VKVALKASNGQFVCAEGGGGRELVANRAEAGLWETFEVVVLEGDRPAPAPAPTPATGFFPLKGCSDFRLFQRFLAGDDIEPVLAQRLACGASILRVFGMKANNTGWELNPAGRPDHAGDLRRFLDALRGRVQVYFTVFADTAALMPQPAVQQAFWAQVVETLRPYASFVIVELCNEFSHPTQRIDPRAFAKPDGLLSSRGSGQTDEDPASPYWDVAGYSARRNVPPDARGFTNYNPYEFQAEYPMRVPKFAQEGLKPEDYRGDPAIARAMGAHAALGVGGFFHSNGGIDSRLFNDPERVCATHFFQGVSQ